MIWAVWSSEVLDFQILFNFFELICGNPHYRLYLVVWSEIFTQRLILNMKFWNVFTLSNLAMTCYLTDIGFFYLSYGGDQLFAIFSIYFHFIFLAAVPGLFVRSAGYVLVLAMRSTSSVSLRFFCLPEVHPSWFALEEFQVTTEREWILEALQQLSGATH